MENDLIEKESWITRNWKWFLPSSLFFTLLIGVLFTSTSKESIADIAQAYTESSLFEQAIEKANKNRNVLETIGKIKPIDKLAILEGNATYTNNKNSVELSVRIQGVKGSGKLDISANKKGKEWNYTRISVRTKTPKAEIKILY